MGRGRRVWNGVGEMKWSVGCVLGFKYFACGSGPAAMPRVFSVFSTHVKDYMAYTGAQIAR
jgi:hypothetical protein